MRACIAPLTINDYALSVVTNVAIAMGRCLRHAGKGRAHRAHVS